jgi:hypothetical protein
MWWAGRRRHFEGASLARHIRWRKVEATLNALPQFITKIDGRDIQFAHIRSPHQDALPLLMTHGWPGSTIKLLKVIEPLRFRARDVNLVMGPRNARSPFGVGFASTETRRGRRAESTSTIAARGVAADRRLYLLVRQPGDVDERTFEITFLERGVEAYVFTFG